MSTFSLKKRKLKKYDDLKFKHKKHTETHLPVSVEDLVLVCTPFEPTNTCVIEPAIDGWMVSIFPKSWLVFPWKQEGIVNSLYICILSHNAIFVWAHVSTGMCDDTVSLSNNRDCNSQIISYD